MRFPIAADVRIDIQESDPYFASLRAQFGEGMLELFDRLPAPGWIAADATHGRRLSREHQGDAPLPLESSIPAPMSLKTHCAARLLNIMIPCNIRQD